MRKTRLKRAVTYMSVGLVCVLFNTMVYHVLLYAGIGAFVANVCAFIAGGQLSFVLHDRMTFDDRTRGGVGWLQRWWIYMTGNGISFGLNMVLAGLLLLVVSDSYAHLIALLVSGLYSAIWNNFVSHRDKSLPWFCWRSPSIHNPVVSVEH